MSSRANAKNDKSVLFILKPDGCCYKPMYLGCAALSTIEIDNGSVTPVYCKDPDKWGSIKVIDYSKSAPDLSSTEISFYHPVGSTSLLKRLITSCKHSLAVNFGTCGKPSVYNDGDKTIILENVFFENYSLEDPVVMAGEDSGIITETTSVKFQNMYEIVSLNWQNRTSENELGLVTSIEYYTYNNCNDYNCVDDNKKLVATTNGCLPSSPPEILWTSNNFSTYNSVSLPVSSTAVTRKALFIENTLYIFVVDGTTTKIFVLDAEELFNNNNANIQEFVTLPYIVNDAIVNGDKIYFVTDNGYTYYFYNNSTQNVQINYSVNSLYSLSAIDGKVVSVGANNTITIIVTEGCKVARVAKLYDENGIELNDNIKSVATIDDKIIVGTETGLIFCSNNCGLTFYQNKNVNTGSSIDKIVFSNKFVGYFISGNNIFRTRDGGCSWRPQFNKKCNIPVSQSKVNYILVDSDPNKVFVSTTSSACAGNIILGSENEEESC